MYAVSDSWNLIHSYELREFIQVLRKQLLQGILGDHTHTCILSFFVSFLEILLAEMDQWEDLC